MELENEYEISVEIDWTSPSTYDEYFDDFAEIFNQTKESFALEDGGPKFDQEIIYAGQDASLVDCFRLSTVLAKEELS